MSKRHRRKKGQTRFVMLEHYVLRSTAWKALSPTEKAAYLELKALYNGRNNGAIGLSARTLADALGSSKDTACRALDGLAKKGFVVEMTRPDRGPPYPLPALGSSRLPLPTAGARQCSL